MRGLQIALLVAALALVAGCALPQQQQPEREPQQQPERAPQQQPEREPQQQQPATPSPEKIKDAFEQLNKAFEKAYERIIAEHGTRSFRVPPAVAYDALQAALTRLAMIVESRDPVFGTLTVAAPAPKPLTLAEWREVVQSDTPLMASILCPRLGAYCRTLKFEPDDYVIVINATVSPHDGGSAVALTTRMREIVPRPGVPRRDYPPPTGVRMALDKIWAQFDKELAARRPGR